MGIFVNSDNSAFQVALNSEIYIDKTGLLTYTNKVMNTLQGYICNSRPRIRLLADEMGYSGTDQAVI